MTAERAETFTLWFGKYKGRSLGWIFQHDPGYLDWLSGPPTDDKQKLRALIAKLYVNGVPSGDPEEREPWIVDAIRRMESLEPHIQQIKAKHRGRAASGVLDPCPECGAGKLEWFLAPNSHIRMCCTSDDCVSFME
jgi:hypothetical protein